MTSHAADAVLFLGHGSRSQAGVQDFMEFTDEVQKRVVRGLACANRGQDDVIFAKGFLELSQPDVAAALRHCCAQGSQRIFLVPVFLFAAGHMKKDIPELVEQTRPSLGQARVHLLPEAGVDPCFAKAAADRLHEAGFCGDNGAVLLVGRGNRDACAQADFERLAQLVRKQSRACVLKTGYLAGSGVDWRQALDALVQTGVTQVYLQPYLWFHGRLTHNMPRWVSDWQASHPAHWNLQIHIGEPLGAHPVLIKCVAKRVLDAVRGAV
ncbi:sirohydrochlorin chelatase [Alicyclobacillus tolerans]|uniref:sirohydrochlorin chelatase n=1 Tax=Alicyclobacillus tolerans TaxID=90970 RepID=UPI001F1967BB|nr:sirohydrochlorin chelatase [Alicyclobacillus tolerans]MCF8565527.1 sirohydrochlorin chelatase [Alicyclobacillus tolerans]